VNERCLVIGGGLIGSRIADRLVSEGHPVKVLSRSFNPWLLARRDGVSKIELVEGELGSGFDAQPLVYEAEVIFFMAGTSTPQLADDAAASSIAGLLQPALACLDLMRRAGRKRIVLASSGGTVYGSPDELPTPETAPTDPISVHGVNCLATEQYALLYARQHGLEPIIIRFSNVYGPGQLARRGFGVIAAWCAALARGEPVTVMGDGSIRRDFLYADDAGAAAVAAAFNATRPFTYNAGCGESVSLLELLGALAEVSGREPTVENLPSRAIDVPVTALDSSQLCARTGWEPKVGLHDGLARCWEWAIENLDATGEQSPRTGRPERA
jgi:UDP-glucose 4-epimerase